MNIQKLVLLLITLTASSVFAAQPSSKTTADKKLTTAAQPQASNAVQSTTVSTQEKLKQESAAAMTTASTAAPSISALEKITHDGARQAFENLLIQSFPTPIAVIDNERYYKEKIIFVAGHEKEIQYIGKRRSSDGAFIVYKNACGKEERFKLQDIKNIELKHGSCY